MHVCAVTLPEIALVVEETTQSHLLEETADLYLWFGEPPDTRANIYPIASEQIVAIVHPDNPIEELDTNVLREIFTGRMRTWQDIGGLNSETEVWVYPLDDEIQESIEFELLNGEPYTSLAWLAPDPAAMLEAVHENTPAIGFLPRAWLTDQVKVIRISTELQETLSQPVLILANVEPQNGIRSFLHCLQTGTGQTTLSNLYQILDE
jgi:phosphate transport system substrate-binding protein